VTYEAYVVSRTSTRPQVDSALLSAADYRQVMADRFAVWNEITGATTTAAA
jgi:hypothetical protein